MWAKMVELAEDEMWNFGKVWASVLVSVAYCYVVGNITSIGLIRSVAIHPIICLFLLLPLNLTSSTLCGTTAFFIAWLANFKLLLFAFGKPPLWLDPPISFFRFLTVACLPVKIKENQPSQNLHKLQNKQHTQIPKNQRNIYPWNFIIKGTLLILSCRVTYYYTYSNHTHQKVLWLLYFVIIYLSLKGILGFVARAGECLLGSELEPHFKQPLSCTSLQDFWGRRWNLMVTDILRPTVYLPARDICTRIIGRKMAIYPAVMITFLVSAIMHEIIFYYMGRISPAFEVTWFFLLHGFCVCVEISAKKSVAGRWEIPQRIAGPITMSFLLATGYWLFLPPMSRIMLDTGRQEYVAVCTFLSSIKHDLSSTISTFAARP